MNVLGIDPGTSCGWALLDLRGARVASGVWDLRPRRHEGGGMRYLRVRRYLEDILAAPAGVLCVGYEEVRRHAGTDAAHVYGGIVGMIAAVCEERRVPYTAIPVGTVKRHATGKGNAPKELMIAAALGRWQVAPEDDNEADALWIADCVRRECGGVGDVVDAMGVRT